jgi:RimJ/RimL family protein N-acetyltransferase
MQVLETEPLVVRHLQPDDLDDLYAICGDPKIMRYVGNNQPISRDLTQKWIEVSRQNYQKYSYGCMAIIHKLHQRFIGYCGLVYAPDNPTAEIIYALRIEYWGQGFATKVARAMLEHGFKHWDLQRIEASVDAENKASVRVTEKLGMKYDRTGFDESNLPTEWYVLDRALT